MYHQEHHQHPFHLEGYFVYPFIIFIFLPTQVIKLPKIMRTNTGNEVVFGFNMTSVMLLETSFNAEVLGFPCAFVCDPL